MTMSVSLLIIYSFSNYYFELSMKSYKFNFEFRYFNFRFLLDVGALGDQVQKYDAR